MKTTHKCNYKVVDVELRWNDAEDPEDTRSALCAIGEYSEDCERCQEIDDQIFYWFEDLAELKDAMTGKHHEFIILNHDAPREPRF